MSHKTFPPDSIHARTLKAVDVLLDSIVNSDAPKATAAVQALRDLLSCPAFAKIVQDRILEEKPELDVGRGPIK